MTVQTFIPSATALTGPALRLHLLELYLLNTDMPDTALPLAQQAEQWIAGEVAIAKPADTGETAGEVTVTVTAPPATAKPARDVEPGKPWVFTDHRTQADLGQTDASPAKPGKAERVPVIERGEATVTDLVANRREDLLRWWLAGKTVGPEMTDHLGASKPTVTRALKVTGISEAFRRGAGGRPAYDLVPLGEPLPAAALALLGRGIGGETSAAVTEIDGFVDPSFEEPVEQPEPEITRKRDYSVVVWTDERKTTLDTLVRQGAEVAEIVQAVGLEEYQVKAQVARQCLTSAWAEAKAAKAAPAEVAAPKPAPARPQLPEDRLRSVVDPNGVPADLETVEIWLRNNGCKLVVESPGLYFCDGAMLTSTELVKRANKARKGLKLPPFSVRKL